MAQTPNKSLQYLFDGDNENRRYLSESLRALDVISNMVLESVSETQTPLSPEPGQAWFIDKEATLDSQRTTGVDDLWTQTFGAATRADHLVAYWTITREATVLQPEPIYGWQGIPIQESAYGYVRDLAGRYQWDGTDWLAQQKIQTLTFRKGFTKGTLAVPSLPNDPPPAVPSAGGIQYYQIGIAPFDMVVTFVEILHHGYENIASESYPAAVLPGIYYTDDNTNTFPGSWNAVVDPGCTGEGVTDGWFASSRISYTQEVHTTSGVIPSQTAPVFSTTIPAGSYIAIGGWDTADVTTPQSVWNGSSNQASLDTIQEIQIRIDYYDATT